jgi:acetyl-CoA carboxylase beta subunit
MMEWGSFITGGITALFMFALFTSDKVVEEDIDYLDNEDKEVEINDFSSRHVKTYCQTCRKIKSHKEIQKDLYQCTKCKRQVDLRRAS